MKLFKEHIKLVLAFAILLCCLFLVWGHFKTEKSYKMPITQLNEKPDNVKAVRDIIYKTDGPGNLNTLDIAYPKNSTHNPLYVMVHGGSWYSGDKDKFDQTLYTFANEGYTVVSINYNLVPDATILDQVYEVGDAVQFLAKHKNKYHVDPDQVVLAGESAGAHLAMRFGEVWTKNPKKYDFSIKGIVDMYGPMDIAYYLHYYPQDPQMAVFIEFPKMIAGDDNSDILTEVKKIDVSVHLSKKLPPILIIHGVQDKRVPYEVSSTFYEKLTEEYGIDVHMVSVKNMDHEYKTEIILPAVNQFLHDYVPVNQ